MVAVVAVVVLWWCLCFFLIFSGASELPTGMSAQLPANGSPANRWPRKLSASGKNCSPAWVCSAPS